MTRSALAYITSLFLGGIVALSLYVPWFFMRPPSALSDEVEVAPALVLLSIGATTGIAVAWVLRRLVQLNERLSTEVSFSAAFLEMSIFPLVGALLGFAAATVLGAIISPAALIGLGTTVTPQQLPSIVCLQSLVGAFAGAFLGIMLKLVLELSRMGDKRETHAR